LTNAAEETFLLGIDGGASKTAIVLANAGGKVLGRARGPGSAIVGEPAPEACEVLRALVNEACSSAGVGIEDVAHCGTGLNGVDFADELAVQLTGIATALGLPEQRVTLANDGIVALWGASPEEKSAIVQHGSGFTAAWRREYGGETLFDHLSAGAIFDIRHEVARAVARMIDGRLPSTRLKELALAHYGVGDERDYAELLYRGRIPPERRRSTPPLVYAAWVEGDPAAKEIVEKAAEDYALAACAMLDKIDYGAAHVALGGGVINRGPDRFRELVAERIKVRYPEATVVAPQLPPEYGSVLMAGHRLGLEVRGLFDGLAGHSGPVSVRDVAAKE